MDYSPDLFVSAGTDEDMEEAEHLLFEDEPHSDCEQITLSSAWTLTVTQS